MLGAWSQHSGLFLQILGVFSLLLLGLPMSIAPLRWASWLRWTIPQEKHLALYFGRCLGVVSLILSLAGLYVSYTPELQPPFLVLIGVNCVAMVLVHLWGALRRIQPLSETIETGLWLLLVLLCVLTFPVSRT